MTRISLLTFSQYKQASKGRKCFGDKKNTTLATLLGMAVHTCNLALLGG
jgi:hypothetical protein